MLEPIVPSHRRVGTYVVFFNICEYHRENTVQETDFFVSIAIARKYCNNMKLKTGSLSQKKSFFLNLEKYHFPD